MFVSIYLRGVENGCARYPRVHAAKLPQNLHSALEPLTVECPQGGNVRKCATAEERVAKNQKTTVRHFGFTEKVYGLPCTVRTLIVVVWKRHLEMLSWELT